MSQISRQFARSLAMNRSQIGDLLCLAGSTARAQVPCCPLEHSLYGFTVGGKFHASCPVWSTSPIPQQIQIEGHLPALQSQHLRLSLQAAMCRNTFLAVQQATAEQSCLQGDRAPCSKEFRTTAEVKDSQSAQCETPVGVVRRDIQ
eukprot:6206587-Amphidinium_carterae.1